MFAAIVGALLFGSTLTCLAEPFLYASNIVDTVWQFDESGQASVFASGLNQPRGLAFDANGRLYVAISGDNSILRFDLDGTRSIFATSQLNGPRGLAFDVADNLYVSNG